MCHLQSRIQGGLLCKQGGIDDFVIGFEPTSHECKSRLTTNQSYLDIDAVDQELILQKEIHVETAHHIDHATPYDVLSSSPSLAAGPSAISTASMRVAVSLCHS